MKTYLNALFFESSILIALSIALLYAGFINGYPIIYHGDSAGYLYMGKELKSSVGTHSIFYGIFLAYFGEKFSLWTAIFIQSFLLALAINSFQKVVFKAHFRVTWLITMLAILPLVFLTGLTKYPSKLVPDVFTPILALSIFSIIASAESKEYRQIIVPSLLIILSFLTQTSNLLMMGAFILVVVIFKFLLFKKLSFRPIIFLSFLFVIATTLLGLLHKTLFDKFYLNKASHVVVLARLSENGTLRKFLSENCSGGEYAYFCGKREFLPGHSEFLYSPKSPLYPNGYWEEAQWELLKHDIEKLNKAILTTPKYLVETVYFTVIQSVRQFFSVTQWENSQGDLIAFRNTLTTYFPEQENNLTNSCQFLGSFKEWEKSIYQYHPLFIFLTFLLLVLFFLVEKNRMILALIVSFLAVNAMVSGGLVLVHGRYQERIFWILPFYLISYFLFKYLPTRLSNKFKI